MLYGISIIYRKGNKMGDLTYTNSMMNEIRELLLNARQHVAVGKYRTIVYLLECW